MREIYFDNAATTRPSDAVIKAYADASSRAYGNPSSLNRLGIDAEREMKHATEVLFKLLNTPQERLFFTSGGTEANNLAVIGAARANAANGRHIITSTAEHPSVLNAFKHLESEGFDVTYAAADKNGHVVTEALFSAIRSDTSLVSIIHVNNETGAINDVDNIAREIKQRNKLTVFHSDGVQGFCKERVSLRNVDMYSFSSHKVHGPKGVGALFAKKRIKIKPLFFGGEQQEAIRPGTENTTGITCLQVAAGECAADFERKHAHVTALRDRMAEVVEVIPDTVINGDVSCSSPYILNVSFLGAKGEVLLHMLEEDGIYVSTGAACNANKKKGTLYNLRYDDKRIESALRFSFSYENKVEEVEYCIGALVGHVERLRKLRV